MSAAGGRRIDRTLEELEDQIWEEVEDPTPLQEKCPRLRKKPISDFTIENLRLMIGQQIGLPHLMPLALNVLENEPLAEGDCYPGDLLMNVVRVKQEFWPAAPDLLARALRVARRAEPRLRERELGIVTTFLWRHEPPTP